ncbi:hypothetical protein FKP32DRAFT_1413252 [Trametes sanguinea]|nr:hypothetical protein FKP32DRAFT_1413252 [Trametes sanguinea]
MLTPPNATSSAVAPNPLSMPKVPALDNTFGALLLGTYGGLILFGVTTHQAYRYFHMYPHDGRMLKGLVADYGDCHSRPDRALLLLQPGIQLLQPTGPPLQCLHGSKLFAVMSGVTMILSQSFFVRRIWLVAPRYKPVVVVAVSAAASLCTARLTQRYANVSLIGDLVHCGDRLVLHLTSCCLYRGTTNMLHVGFLLAGSVKGFIIPTYAEYGNWQWLVSSGSTMAFTADTLLTVILIAVLRRSRTGIKRTDSMIDVMILYAVNTGLVTGIFNVLTMVFSFAQKKNLIWIGIGIIDARSAFLLLRLSCGCLLNRLIAFSVWSHPSCRVSGHICVARP